MSDAPPIGRFTPAPGIFVDRTEKSVLIEGKMELYGPEGNSARAQAIERSINTTWTTSFPDGYTSTCRISVRFRPEGSSAGTAAQIEAKKMAGPSHVTTFPGMGREMTLNANETDAFTWTATHEFGHVIGLQDRYSEGIMSKIASLSGGTRTNIVDPRYRGNLMAEDQGIIESKNVEDVVEENASSAYWINDDDEVRDWLDAHSRADIAKLSTADKLKAIKTLMGGWISDADVAGIGKICGAVTTAAEANAIRKGVNLLDFSSIGQRTAVRVIFSKMP